MWLLGRVILKPFFEKSSLIMFILWSPRMKTWLSALTPPPPPRPRHWSFFGNYSLLLSCVLMLLIVDFIFLVFICSLHCGEDPVGLFIWKLLSFSFIVKVCIMLMIFLPSSFFFFLVGHLSFSFWTSWTSPLIFILFFTIFHLSLCFYLEGELLNFYLPTYQDFHLYYIFSFSSSLLCFEFFLTASFICFKDKYLLLTLCRILNFSSLWSVVAFLGLFSVCLLGWLDSQRRVFQSPSPSVWADCPNSRRRVGGEGWTPQPSVCKWSHELPLRTQS